MARRATAIASQIGQSWDDIENYAQARLAQVGAAPGAILSQPEPRWIGDAARARQMLAGNFLFAGHLVSAPELGPWRINPPTTAYRDALHGFVWVEDFAALGDSDSRRVLQDWVFGWIAQYGDGAGPGWRPDLAGRRMLRWISHAPLILKGVAPEDSQRFFVAMGAHARYLGRRWRAARVGLPRIEALTGLVYAGLTFERYDVLLRRAANHLGAECARLVAEDGAIPSRDPEELAEIMTLLVWAARTMDETGADPDPRHQNAIARIAPALRALRFGDGGMARFHGGDAGPPGRLDRTLADAAVRTRARPEGAMGYQRITAGRAAAIIDCAAPPPDGRAQASTLALEFASGRRRIIVNCGPGAAFGEDWARASRTTAASSTLSIERASSARLPPERKGVENEIFLDGPKRVLSERSQDMDGQWLSASHDGFCAMHGLTHERRLFLAPDGRDFRGEDTLSANDPRDRKRFDRFVAGAPQLGAAFDVRFHLHPDVTASLALGGSAIAIALASGEQWFMRQSGGVLSLEDSVYFDTDRQKPRATKQIVVTGRALEYWGRVTWAFRRAEDGRRNTRDLED